MGRRYLFLVLPRARVFPAFCRTNASLAPMPSAAAREPPKRLTSSLRAVAGRPLGLRPGLKLRRKHQLVYIELGFAYFGFHCTNKKRYERKFIPLLIGADKKEKREAFRTTGRDSKRD
jgi:hypothetical protein